MKPSSVRFAAGRRRMALAVTVVAALAALVVGGAALLDSRDPVPRTGDRQAEVAEKGSRVMPFDLERTTHRFAKTASGGEQTVVADDPSDAEQVRLIRAHLTEEVARFGRGDFGDPAAIHGSDMPGLAELAAGHGRISTAYAETPAGARITYATEEPDLVTALHRWFDAQVSDHGSHARHG